MKTKTLKLTLRVILIAAFLSPVFTLPARAAGQGAFTGEEAAEFAERYGALVGKALADYNNGDYREFYRNFTAQRHRRTTDEVFNSIWVDGYMKEFGKFISKSFVRDKCDFNTKYPLMVYKAKFEKDDNVEIKAVFAEEDGCYKLFYLRFDKLLANK